MIFDRKTDFNAEVGPCVAHYLALIPVLGIPRQEVVGDDMHVSGIILFNSVINGGNFLLRADCLQSRNILNKILVM